MKIANKRAADKNAHEARERKSKFVETVGSPDDEVIAGEARENVENVENVPCKPERASEPPTLPNRMKNRP